MTEEETIKEVAYDVARLTVRLLLHSIERFAAQVGAAGHADEAVDVENLVHGRAAGALTHHILSTACTASWVEEEERRLRKDQLKGRKSIPLSLISLYTSLMCRFLSSLMLIEQKLDVILNNAIRSKRMEKERGVKGSKEIAAISICGS